MFKVYSPQIINLGDFLNAFPVFSGIAKGVGDQLKLVVPPNFRQFNGFREFMQAQDCIGELVYRDEIMMMEEQNYLFVTYSQEEFKHLTERPNRPIETMRNEKFVRDNYPDLNWEVDDNFRFAGVEYHTIRDTQIVGDRWANVIDTRRDFNILKNSGLFDNPFEYEFLDYTKPLLENMGLIASSTKPFIGTFTGSGMLADLMGMPSICVYDDSMLPTWNDMPIEYSYWKHYYGDRQNSLCYIGDFK